MVFHNFTMCIGVGSDRADQPAEALSSAPCQRARAAHDRRAVMADLSKGLPVDLVHGSCDLLERGLMPEELPVQVHCQCPFSGIPAETTDQTLVTMLPSLEGYLAAFVEAS